MPILSDADEQQPAMNLDQPDATLEPTLDQGDAMIAEMAYPVSADDSGMPASSDAVVADVPPAASQGGSEQAKPAARWDRAARYGAVRLACHRADGGQRRSEPGHGQAAGRSPCGGCQLALAALRQPAAAGPELNLRSTLLEWACASER